VAVSVTVSVVFWRFSESVNTVVTSWRVPSALTDDGGLYSAVGTELPSAADRRACPVVRLVSEEAAAAISNVAEDVGKTTLRVGAGFTEATVLVRCVVLADFAVPAEAPCDDGDDVSADAVGAPTPSAAAPTPSATANPPT
jgi:hypothetical protein